MKKFRNYNILYIEDEEHIRTNYGTYFQQLFNNVYLAEDAIIGFKLYQKHKPDIMVVDISLPIMDGLTLVEKIRKKDPSTKIIILSAHSDAKRLLQATELKLTKYLVKPIAREELIDALHLAIDEISKYDVVAVSKVYLKDGLIWDKTKNELLGGASLTKNEKKMMEILCQTPKRIYEYDDIILGIWWDFEEDKKGALKTLVKNLRKKLPADTIENVYGQGYRINLE